MQSSVTAEKNVLEHVRAQSTTLSASAQRVARIVLSRPHEVVDMSAENLARTSGTSVGTVMRFCNSVVQAGFQSFKLMLAASIRPDQWDPAEQLRALQQATSSERMLRTIVDQVTSTVRSIDYSTILSIAEKIVCAKRILIVSNGPSQPIAMTLGYALNSEGHHVSYPMDHETQEVIAQQLTGTDVCFVVSHSGVTPAVLDVGREANANNATVLALTSYQSSDLTQLATHSIIAGAAEDTYRNADAASRPVHLAVINALLAAIEDARDRTTPKPN